MVGRIEDGRADPKGVDAHGFEVTIADLPGDPGEVAPLPLAAIVIHLGQSALAVVDVVAEITVEEAVGISKMLRYKRKHSPRISNRLAVFASLTLLVSALAGMTPTNLGGAEAIAGVAPSSVVDAEPTNVASSKKRIGKKKSFKVSLFLFRLD